MPVISAVASIGGAIIGSNSSNDASDAQVEASEAGIAEQRRQFDLAREILSPFVDAGGGAISQMQALTGQLGDEQYQAALANIEASPEYQGLVEDGEEAILANASATGGLRGGNVQGALAQFRPQFLRDAIDTRYSRLSGLAQLGQASAAGSAAQAINTGQGISNSFGQIGAAQAGNALAQGQTFSNLLGDFASIAGGGGFGGTVGTPGITAGGTIF